MKRHLFSILAVAAFALPATAFAQFKMPSFGGTPAAGANSNSSGDLQGRQSHLVQAYAAADKTVLLANADMLAAVGMQGDAAKLRATADSLNGGSTQGNLADSDKALSESTVKLSEQLKDTKPLDDASKKTFASGMLKLALSAVQYADVVRIAQDVASGISSANPLQMMKLKAAIYIVASVPKSAKMASDSLSNVTKFATAHDIAKPSESDISKAL